MISYADKVNRSYQVSRDLDRIFREACKLEGFNKSDVLRMLIEAYVWVIRTNPELKEAPLKYRVLEALKSTCSNWTIKPNDYTSTQKHFTWF